MQARLLNNLTAIFLHEGRQETTPVTSPGLYAVDMEYLLLFQVIRARNVPDP